MRIYARGWPALFILFFYLAFWVIVGGILLTIGALCLTAFVLTFLCLGLAGAVNGLIVGSRSAKFWKGFGVGFTNVTCKPSRKLRSRQ
jgi:hypothetical protein